MSSSPRLTRLWPTIFHLDGAWPAGGLQLDAQVDVVAECVSGSHINRVVRLSNTLLDPATTRARNALIGTIGRLTLKV
ncbi:hypothetical protein A5740_17995 [Mycobacterium sp. GA-1841]|nr:hypothetical protein A5740_17995 [Mycobacterium sp. GA-1841]